MPAVATKENGFASDADNATMPPMNTTASQPTDNPLLAWTAFPAFDRIAPEHAEPAIARILADAGTEVARIEREASPAWDKLAAPLARLEEPLDFAWGLVTHLLSVMNSDDWRRVHDTIQPRIVAFSLRVRQSEPIFHALESLRGGVAAWDALAEPRRRIVESALRQARLSGVGLPPAHRQRFNAISEELAQVGTTFSHHVLDATREWHVDLSTREEVDGLPPSVLMATAGAAARAGLASTPENGPWRITLEQPVYQPVMQYATRRDLRETLYRAYIARASAGALDNTPLLTRILELRAELAGLLGFGSYAEVSLSNKMAGTVDAAEALLADLRRAAWDRANDELRELAAFARAHGHAAELMNWDVPYWSERMREAHFGYRAEDLRPYFQFPKVLEGLFALAANLFGIAIVPADGEVAVWHPDVRFFRVEEDGRPIACFYLDPYSRPETKRGGAWMNPMRPRNRRPDGSVTLPVTCLVCNQTAPSGAVPSLMTFTEVTTLFHEFGHALQHMLTTVDEPGAAGIHNVEWDAVELASQFMENWCYHWPTLRGLSAHVDDGRTIPRDLFDKVAAARTFQSALAMMRQLLFAALDLELHHRYQPGGHESPTDVKNRVARAYAPMPMLPEDRFLCSFQHIFDGGYAAGYYSYKWAEVLAADAFEAFEEAGLDCPATMREVGRRYRDTILALGGGAHPMDVFQRFRGRDPHVDALLRHVGLAAG